MDEIIERTEESKIIWKTENFMAVNVEKPFVSREEGGHMMILGTGDKFRYNSSLDFTPSEILEFERLKQILCEAYIKVMKEHGVDIIRINYFEAGNWAWKPNNKGEVTGKAHFHTHIFGRTVDAKYQKFPDAPHLPDRKTGFYDNFLPITDEDILDIRKEMKIIEQREKFNDEKWKI